MVYPSGALLRVRPAERVVHGSALQEAGGEAHEQPASVTCATPHVGRRPAVGRRPVESGPVGAGGHTRRTASGGVVGRLEPPGGSAVMPTPSAPRGPPVSSIVPEELPVSTSPAGSMVPLRLYQSSYTR